MILLIPENQRDYLNPYRNLLPLHAYKVFQEVSDDPQLLVQLVRLQLLRYIAERLGNFPSYIRVIVSYCQAYPPREMDAKQFFLQLVMFLNRCEELSTHRSGIDQEAAESARFLCHRQFLPIRQQYFPPSEYLLLRILVTLVRYVLLLVLEKDLASRTFFQAALNFGQRYLLSPLPNSLCLP